jgi:transcriptional regulator with XRE-family HTH domain
MGFFEEVKRLAKVRGTTIEALAESIPGKNRDSYYGWRRSNNLPRADEAVKIATALGTTVEYLVTGNPPAGLSQEALEIGQIFDILSTAGQKAAQSMMEGLLKDYPQRPIQAESPAG